MLRSIPLFAGVSRSDIDALNKQFEMIYAPPGEPIFSQGGPSDNLYVIVSGRVKLERAEDEQRTYVVGVLGPGDAIEDLAVLDGGPNPYTATAMDGSSLARLPTQALHVWMAIRPHVAALMLMAMARRLGECEVLLSELVVADIPARVANQVLEMGHRFGVGDSRGLLVEHGLSQAELGQLVGTSRETINRTLTDFAKRGWLRTGTRRLIIYDLEKLAGRARLAVR